MTATATETTEKVAKALPRLKAKYRTEIAGALNEEFKYDKPAEYEELVASGRLEEHLVEAYPRQVERGFRVFGFAALTIGLTLVALIIYAILFAYR